MKWERKKVPGEVGVSQEFVEAFATCARHWSWTGDVLEEMKAVCRKERDYRFYLVEAAKALRDGWLPDRWPLDQFRYNVGLPPLNEALKLFNQR